jgi:hypothetical protein
MFVGDEALCAKLQSTARELPLELSRVATVPGKKAKKKMVGARGSEGAG